MAEIFPVAKLRDRYGLGKQAELNRRKHLGIKPTKIEGTYYITEQQLRILDALDYWLNEQGGRMADFNPETMVDLVEASGGLTKSNTVDSTRTEYQEATIIESEQSKPEWESLIESLVEKIQPARSPLQNWRELEEAYQQGWLLTTQQVSELVGSKPQGRIWQRGAFIFSKSGKIGYQTAWSIEKI